MKYIGIHYEKCCFSLEVTDECYVINSFQVFFDDWMACWLDGGSQNHIRLVERLAQILICSPHVSQVAALEAMSCEEELSQNLNVYQKS